MKRSCFLFAFLLIIFQGLFAQTQELNSDKIYKKIEKLSFLGSVLFVGAHPDDENNAMISYLSNDLNAEVGYLALNRGDGGQNILGSEKRELLGVIRTQELLAARNIDGGKQFFTRANDFGFSKGSKETLNKWDRDKVLSDVVWVFRKFRPDVVINRFDHRDSLINRKMLIKDNVVIHGHHTASAVLSSKAFDLSNREDKFSNQLEYYKSWKPQKLYTNISWMKWYRPDKWKEADKSKYLALNLGVYYPLKGISNTELAAEARSQHKSQGMGTGLTRGENVDFLEAVKGNFPENDSSVFAGLDTSWSRLNDGKKIGEALKVIRRNYDFQNPSASIPKLIKVYQMIDKLDNSHWKSIKLKEIKTIIAAAAGLYLEASSAKEFVTPGEKLDIEFEAINRSDADIKLNNITISNIRNSNVLVEEVLRKNIDFKQTKSIQIPSDLKYSSPYWLRKPYTRSMFEIDDQKLIGLAETEPQLRVVFEMTINGVPIGINRNIKFKTVTPVEGEVHEPLAIVPKISMSFHNQMMIFSDSSSKKLKVDIKAYADNVLGTLTLNHPEGWRISPNKMKVDLNKNGDNQTISFTITPPKSESEAHIKAKFKDNKGKTFSKQLHIIDYPHIPTQTALLPAKLKVNKADIKTKGKNIAYVMGSGDEMAQSLRQLGYQVDIMEPSDINKKKLKNYDAVVMGIRAYNVNKDIGSKQSLLFDYVKDGGTLVMQYNRPRGLKVDRLLPYDLNLCSDKVNRVTDEKSDITFLVKDNPVLNTPNKITQKDFKGWVQERGLYFPCTWGEDFTPILGMHDKYENELKGGLLIANYGDGYFVYTGLSFFRELPAGVIGAYRLFANLLALGS